MSQATKTLTVIFLVSLALVALRWSLQGTGTSEALAKNVIEFDKEKIDQIVIKAPNQAEVTLAKSADGWSVTDADANGTTYDADATVIESAMDQIAELAPKSLVTRNEAEFTRYQVDTTGTLVQLFSGSKLVDELVIGRFQFVSQQEFNTYVRNASSNDVVAVNGFLGSVFGRKLDAWRNKTIWDEKLETITQVDFTYPADSSFTIRRVGNEDWVSGMDSLSVSKTKSLLNSVRTLKAASFETPGITPDSFGDATYRVTVHLDTGAKRELYLKDSETDFIAKASDYPYTFTLNKSSFTSSTLKTKNDLLK